MSVFTVSITIGVNTSPLAGTEGRKLTSQMIRDRLHEEQGLNPATIKAKDTDGTDKFDVYGASLVQLVTLVEDMRREGFELTVSDPQCLFRRDRNDGSQLLEPYEEVVVDSPTDYSGAVVQELTNRSGLMIESSELGADSIRTVFHVPTRMLFGFDEVFANATCGFGDLNRSFLKYDLMVDGFLNPKGMGFLISSETGNAVGYALAKFQDRGVFYVGPQDKVYAGMIIGESSRHEDMEINVLKGKSLTNMRASGSDEAYHLAPPKIMTVGGMVSCLTVEECIEVTPSSLRMRKKVLDLTTRKMSNGSQKTGVCFKILED
jgi:GTP-binding protein